MVVKEDQRQAEQFTAGVRKLISSLWCLVFGDSLTRLVDDIGLAKLPTLENILARAPSPRLINLNIE